MAVADRMGQPAQAVVPAGGDDRVLSVLVHGFFTDQVSEYVIRAGYPPPVPVDVQGQVAFFVIPEGFCISCLVDSFPYLSEAVVAVPDGAAVPVDGPADLAGRGILITFRYAVGEADAGDPAPAVQTVVDTLAVPVRDPGDLISVVVLVALKDFLRAVPPLPLFCFSDLSVQCILICGLIPETVSLHGWHVLKIAASFLHHLSQAVGDTTTKNQKLIESFHITMNSHLISRILMLSYMQFVQYLWFYLLIIVILLLHIPFSYTWSYLPSLLLCPLLFSFQ